MQQPIRSQEVASWRQFRSDVILSHTNRLPWHRIRRFPRKTVSHVFFVCLLLVSFYLFQLPIFVFYRPIMFSVVSVSLQEGVAMWPLPMMPLVCHMRAPRHVHNCPLGNPIPLLLPHRHLRPPGPVQIHSLGDLHCIYWWAGGWPSTERPSCTPAFPSWPK